MFLHPRLLALLIALTLSGCAVSSPNDPVAFDPIPPDIPSGSRVPHNNHPDPVPGFAAAIGWLDSMHDTRLTGVSKVEIRSARLYACVAGRETLLTEGIYDTVGGKVTGGLYTRTPWFHSAPEMFVSTYESSTHTVTFSPGDQP